MRPPLPALSILPDCHRTMPGGMHCRLCTNFEVYTEHVRNQNTSKNRTHNNFYKKYPPSPPSPAQKNNATKRRSYKKQEKSEKKEEIREHWCPHYASPATKRTENISQPCLHRIQVHEIRVSFTPRALANTPVYGKLEECTQTFEKVNNIFFFLFASHLSACSSDPGITE